MRRCPIKVYKLVPPGPHEQRAVPTLVHAQLIAEGRTVDARREDAAEKLKAAGYSVRSLSFTTDGGMVAYVTEPGEKRHGAGRTIQQSSLQGRPPRR